ncbi:hypothetical protein ACIBI4_31145 [Streptomyces sp. NPDC050418]|uniref:hypothetical protein n=1 Tax=Streptomyces sp. NPDC050418 TaxID=3365612 RepID=UPI0037A62272
MQRQLEIQAELTARLGGGEGFHHVHWRSKIELALDCFMCERTARTTVLELGAERSLCSGSTSSGFPSHYTAARIAAFDITSGDDRLSLNAIVSFWWAPFTDARTGLRGAAPTLQPWVRLHLGYNCPDEPATDPHQFTTQTNTVRPASESCTHCTRPVATSLRAPTIRLLD